MHDLNNLDMSKNRTWDMTMMFSAMGYNYNFVYENLPDGSVQVYTMKHPLTDGTKFDATDESQLVLDLENGKYEWRIFNSIEVYTINLPVGDVLIDEINQKYAHLRVLKGLI